MNAETGPWVPRRLLVAVLATLLLLTGCDADGDGFDDTTGEPVAVQEQGGESSSSGCGPGGVEWLCGGESDEASYEYVATPTEKATTAHHEAGHAAIAREYGWKIISVRVYPDGSGHVKVWGLAWKDPRQRLAFYYAGAVATGSEQGAWGNEDTKGDFDYAEEILDRFGPDEASGVEASARAEASRIVAERATEIDRDAALLLERGRL